MKVHFASRQWGQSMQIHELKANKIKYYSTGHGSQHLLHHLVHVLLSSNRRGIIMLISGEGNGDAVGDHGSSRCI